MIGSIASVPLPDGTSTDIGWRRPDPLQSRLYEGWGFEVPIHTWPRAPRRLVRVSAQLYNRRDQFVRLAAALRKGLETERAA